MRKLFSTLSVLFFVLVSSTVYAATTVPVQDSVQVDKNIQTVKAFYQASEDKSDKNVERFFAKNYQLVDLGVIKNLSNQRSKADNVNVMQRVEAGRKAFPDFKITINDIFGQDNKVFADITLSGHQTGEFLGIAPTGKLINLHWFVVFTFDNNGKIIKTTQLNDELHLMEQLGYIVLT